MERATVSQGSYDFFSQVDPRRGTYSLSRPLEVPSYANTALRDALKLLWWLTVDRLLDIRPAMPRVSPTSLVRLDYERRFNWTVSTPRECPRTLATLAKK